MAKRKSDTVKKSDSIQKRTSSSGRKKTGTTRRRSSSKKIVLDKNKVSLLAGVIFLICCVCIAINVLGTTAKKQVKVPQVTSQKIEQPAPAKKPQASPAVPKTSAPAKKSVEKAPETKPVTQKQPESVKKIDPQKSVQVASAKGDTSSAKKESGTSVTKTPAVPQQKENKSVFAIPPAKNNATIVMIIDDAGQSVENTKKYARLPFPLTIAVLPKLSHSKDCAYVVRSSGKELILHQPMQSLNHAINPGPGKITVDMSFAQIRSIINENLAEIGPGVKGLNNHEGSEVTEDVLRIGAVLDTCMENNIYFLDSRTTANTQAPQAALERDMKIYEKAGPYIDNVISRDAMLKELYKSLDFANKNGKAIIIGHVDKSAKILPALLEEMYPELVKAGYKFATPSMLK